MGIKRLASRHREIENGRPAEAHEGVRVLPFAVRIRTAVGNCRRRGAAALNILGR